MYDKQASKRYYENNKKDLIEKCKEYRTKNKEYFKEYSKIYYQNNKEKYNDISKKHYYKDKYKDKYKDYHKEYYENNKDKYNKTENLNFKKDYYYYRKLPEELKVLVDIEGVKKDRKELRYKTTLKTVLNKDKPLIEIIEGKKTILFE